MNGGTSSVTQLVPATEPSSTPVGIQLVPTDHQPTPRTYEGKKYFATVDVAKIIGVTKQAVEKWRNTLYMNVPLFTADRTSSFFLAKELQNATRFATISPTRNEP